MNLNTKKWIALALMLIVVGVAGMSYYNFDFRQRSSADGKTTSHDVSAHTERWQFTQGELQNFYVDTDFDVEVQLTSSTDTNYVEVSGEMPQQLIKALQSTKIEKNTLNLKLKEENWEFIHFDFKNEDLKIIIAMNPNEQLKEVKFNSGSSKVELIDIAGDNINITSSSGDIKGKGIAATHLEVISTSGDSSFSHIKTEDMSLSSSSGEIEVEVATGNITASSQSGEIELDQTTGLLNIKTSSGDITSEQHNGDGTFQTSSGNVNIEGQRANNLEILTSSGDVSVSTDQGFQGTYEVNTSSGDVDVPTSPSITEDKIKIKTSSGNVTFY